MDSIQRSPRTGIGNQEKRCWLLRYCNISSFIFVFSFVQRPSYVTSLYYLFHAYNGVTTTSSKCDIIRGLDLYWRTTRIIYQKLCSAFFLILVLIDPVCPSSFHPFILSSFHPFILSSFHPFILSSFHPFILSSFHPFILSSFHPFILSSLAGLLYLLLLIYCTEFAGNIERQRIFFESYAKENGFDPRVPENWYALSSQQIMSAKVCTFNALLSYSLSSSLSL